MAIKKYLNYTPCIHNTCYIDDTSVIIGKVTIDENSSVWCNVVIRGDVSSITIGQNTNIQDGSILHVVHNRDNVHPEGPLNIGNNVTIGHNAILHACTIGNNVLVGMGSIILDNAIIEDNTLIGAGSLVPPNKLLKSGFLYVGSPIKEVRKLSEQEILDLEYSAINYVNIKNNYLKDVK